MQDEFGIAVGLVAPLEHQVAAAAKAMLSARFGAIGRYCGSPAFCRSTTAAIRARVAHHLSLRCRRRGSSQLAICWLEMRSVARSSIRPISWMSGTLEQPDALIDPAHHIAQNALGVVVQLLLDFLGATSCRAPASGASADCPCRVSRSPAMSCLLPRRRSTAVIVQRMQRRGGGRGHPGGVGAGLGMADLVLAACRPSGRARPTCPCRSAPCPQSPRPGRSARCGSHRP